MARLSAPNEAFIETMRDGIWLRRVAYFLLLFSILCIAILPLLAPSLASLAGAPTGSQLTLSGTITPINDVLGPWVQDIASATSGVTPGYAKPWVEAIVSQPLMSFTIIALAAVLWLINSVLRDRIADDARCAWFAGQAAIPVEPKRGPFLKLARLCRSRHKLPAGRGIMYWPIFVGTLLVVAVALFLYVDRVLLMYEIGFGHFCRLDKGQKPRALRPGIAEVAEGFETSNPCWDTGIFVEKDRTYLMELEMTKPFLDKSKVADIAGFKDSDLAHTLGAPLKRWWNAEYFQLIGRIGDRGMVEWPLQPVSGIEPLVLGKEADLADSGGGPCKKSSAGVEEASQKQAALRLRTRLVSRFTASQSGELFLYVNDSIFGSNWLAFGLGYDCFYRNNSGAAKITISFAPDGAPDEAAANGSRSP